VGTAFATLLERAGHEVVDDPADAEVVLITTPDDRIAEVCEELARRGAFRPGQVVVHASGATALDALGAARDAGAGVLSLHPLQTFPNADAAIEHLPGSAMAVTAREDAVAELGERLARDVGARPFRLPDELKPLYHAAAVFASNYVVTVLGEAERLFAGAGLEDRAAWMPLTRATIENVERVGPEAALTGPAVRGDAGTVRANVEAIERALPDAAELYARLARATLRLAARAGRLDADRRRAVEDALSRWR
jgi:predicted short-subunit dehydrogenase-like oxidoreductase (DUF2520 family)